VLRKIEKKYDNARSDPRILPDPEILPTDNHARAGWSAESDG